MKITKIQRKNKENFTTPSPVKTKILHSNDVMLQLQMASKIRTLLIIIFARYGVDDFLVCYYSVWFAIINKKRNNSLLKSGSCIFCGIDKTGVGTLFNSLAIQMFVHIILIVCGLYIFARRYFSGGVCRASPSLDGRIAIVTGANTGIGKETAFKLAQLGATVVLAVRDTKVFNMSFPLLKDIRKAKLL